MSKKIQYYARNVYGETKYYPIDYADQLSLLTGCTTLRNRDFTALTALGFEFSEVLDPKMKGRG